jgi:E3 ubiquitin-protein ligase HUWE1
VTRIFLCAVSIKLDLPEYPSKQHLEERLLLAIHEANEGFGFG